MEWMLKNSNGEPDGSWTLTVASWVVVSLCVMASMVESSFIKAPDATLLLGYLGAMTGNYLLRRNKKDTLAADSAAEEEDQHEGE